MTRSRLRLPVTPQQAELLLALYEADGAFVGRDDLMLRVSGTDAFESVLKVQVCNVRKVIGRDAIANDYKAGYRLTPKGMAIVRIALPHGQVAA